MIPEHRLPTHPGQLLLKEFLEPLGVSQTAFAKHLRISIQRLNELIKGKRGMTPETAWLLAQALGTSPQVWLNLQTNYALARNRPQRTVKRLPNMRRAVPV